MAWIGVDMSESGGVAVLVGPGEEVERDWEFENTPQGRRVWLEELSSYEGVNLVLETTESFSERIAEEAMAWGYRVYVVSTNALKCFRELERYEDKNDSLDGLLLGRMGHRGLRSVRPAVLFDPASVELRGLARLRHRMVELRTELGQKLRAGLLRLSPEISSLSWRGPKPRSATFLAVLERWPDLVSLGRAQRRTVIQLVQKVGHYPKPRAEEIAECLQQWAREAEKMDPSRREVALLELSLLRENLELQNRQIRLLDRRIREQVLEHPQGPALLEVPGIGFIVAAWLLAEALPRAQSATEGQLATYSGLTPASRDSGRSRRSRLRRFVNRRLASIYFTSAVASLKGESLDRDYYEKKKAEFRGHPAAHVKAIIALARQRHKVIYKILQGETRYNEMTLARSTLSRARDRAA